MDTIVVIVKGGSHRRSTCPVEVKGGGNHLVNYWYSHDQEPLINISYEQFCKHRGIEEEQVGAAYANGA